MTAAPAPSEFIQRWQASGGAERANYQFFLSELCDLLAVPRPDPSQPDNTRNHYVFDRSITLTHPDGSSSTNFIDLYTHSCFVLETKQGIEAHTPVTPSPGTPGEGRGEGVSADSLLAQLRPARRLKKGHGLRGSKSFDDALIRAKGQAEAYVRSIPDDNPPVLSAGFYNSANIKLFHPAPGDPGQFLSSYAGLQITTGGGGSSSSGVMDSECPPFSSKPRYPTRRTRGGRDRAGPSHF